MIAEEKYYRIGEVAKLYNLTTPTIRFYEEIGLFPNQPVAYGCFLQKS